nr:B12-binding domain-containing radical SAM protein [Anaerocolumna cellulosilytica]
MIGINAKYIHSNLAIHYLKSYAKEFKDSIMLMEFTINQYTDHILQSIYREKPEFIGFSCYLWNMSMVKELCTELRKLLPDTKIWLGGPEVTYDSLKCLRDMKAVDGIMYGEGEETFLELLKYYHSWYGIKEPDEKISMNKIKGITYRGSAVIKEDDSWVGSDQEELFQNSFRNELDISTIPFPYEEMEKFKNKIIYYETSRGCPYSCSYCLSSIDKKVRLRDFELVKQELSIFLAYKVPQVKFVDRTFNCNRRHALDIWRYIKEQDNGITNFHFEVSADILDKEELALLSTLRPGLVQLEIGVQSTNDATVTAIRRKMDISKLKEAVDYIHKGKNIHQHLDLIAGLPYEDMDSFQNSFNEVYEMQPDQLQLGFLKVLKGSAMEAESRKWGIVYKSKPPYEVLYTNWLSYEDILTLKKVEEMAEVYYNSGQFQYAIKYMEHFFATPYKLYEALGRYYDKKEYEGISHSRIRRYEILLEFFTELIRCDKDKELKIAAFQDILVHDLYLREKLKSRPRFAEDCNRYKQTYKEFYADNDKLMECLRLFETKEMPEQVKPYLHVEHYSIDIKQTVKKGEVIKKEQFVLYDYLHRNPLDSQARTLLVNL